MNAYIGEIKLFAINFVPQGFFRCDGSLLTRSMFPALYSIIGTAYGTTTSTNFALPNLQGRVALDAGQAPGLSPYNWASTGGTENVTLNLAQIPSHSHTFNGRSGNGPTRTAVPTNTSYLANFAVTLAGVQTAVAGYAPTGPATTIINPATITPALGNTNGTTSPHENRAPYLAMAYFICATDGEYPINPN